MVVVVDFCDCYMLMLVISYVILIYNCGWIEVLVDGIVVMLLYNLLFDGGIKYNLFNGGLVDIVVIIVIVKCVNEILFVWLMVKWLLLVCVLCIV